jgi:hypothetical protein
VPVFDPASATGRMLAIDLDVSRGDVDHQAAELGQLLERLGVRHVAGGAASAGGRHLLVKFARLLPWLELRDVARAIALRFPAVDPAPMCSLGGQISPPGSRAKRGGWRVLSAPPGEARAAIEYPNGPEAWNALLAEFAAELRQGSGATDTAAAEMDDTGVPWVPRPGGRAPLGAELDQVARTGRWDRSRSCRPQRGPYGGPVLRCGAGLAAGRRARGGPLRRLEGLPCAVRAAFGARADGPAPPP